VTGPLAERTRRVAVRLLLAFGLVCTTLSAVSAVLFTGMDAALLQLTFLGALAACLGSYAGGLAAAQVEEDACGELDMGMLSSVGALTGAWGLSLAVLPLAGLGLLHDPRWPPGIAGGLTLLGAGLAARPLLGWTAAPGFDERGYRLGADGRRLPDREQPLRMRDRVGLILGGIGAILLGLTLAMGLFMRSNLGHPVMLAGMAYGMGGPMIGGLIGGWLAGALDWHRGDPVHDNPVMIAGMASMGGMMGAMPAGMVGGMMAIMGDAAAAWTFAAAVASIGLCAWGLQGGRWRLVPAGTLTFQPRATPGQIQPAPQRVTGGAWLRVSGMSCAACIGSVARGVAAVPGVAGVEVDLADGLVQVRWGPGFAGLSAVYDAIDDAGYSVVRDG
jgi:copper chaperone CopZ